MYYEISDGPKQATTFHLSMCVYNALQNDKKLSQYNKNRLGVNEEE